MRKESVSGKSVSNESASNNSASDKQSSLTDDDAILIVKIISIYEYTIAGFGIILGLILLFGGQLLMELVSFVNLNEFLVALIGGAILFIAIFLIAFSIFTMFLARALSNHKNWARIFLVVCSSAGAITALLTLPSGILGLLINAAIVYFLGFNEKVKGLFR